jgi:hypothetical protein
VTQVDPYLVYVLFCGIECTALRDVNGTQAKRLAHEEAHGAAAVLMASTSHFPRRITLQKALQGSPVL